mmetsp:Transcript_47652/g.123561  ORF Transcript_47652/g.123561 Transcript_47652/m.123561 type:complete len:207 (-) Transcript_47652:936-1556(-)
MLISYAQLRGSTTLSMVGVGRPVQIYRSWVFLFLPTSSHTSPSARCSSNMLKAAPFRTFIFFDICFSSLSSDTVPSVYDAVISPFGSRWYCLTTPSKHTSYVHHPPVFCTHVPANRDRMAFTSSADLARLRESSIFLFASFLPSAFSLFSLSSFAFTLSSTLIPSIPICTSSLSLSSAFFSASVFSTTTSSSLLLFSSTSFSFTSG